ncbi:MAG TPA: hypothetical protein VKR30_04530, partial [Candidatus Limnocylindrales bacterium]|nr:hypothetical protein [Candidatus Limnocylindrales bacterium]
LPRLEARTEPPRTLAVLGASRRAVNLVEGIAARTPWRVLPASPETHDPREMTALALRADVTALLLGSSEPPGPDEGSALDDLAALVAAVAQRRPELHVVLAGPITNRAAWREGLGDEADSIGDRIHQAPPLRVRSGPDEPLREILEGLLPRSSDTRFTAVRAAISLADVLARRIELIEIGLDGGLRAIASPGVADQGPVAVAVRSARAGLIDADPEQGTVDSVLAWTTGSLDRHRMGDRLRDLRSNPWADASGEGARLRLAAARAALSRLVALTPELSAMPAPDLTIAAGGVFALAPGQAVALAIADVVRRAGATQLAIDHARLLGPLGTIEDPDERRPVVADLADDLLAPIGTVVVVGGIPTVRRRGVPVGSIRLEGDSTATSEHDLLPGDLAFVDLPPGDRALATLTFRNVVRLGRRTRRVSVPVSGGLAGVLVDLRDVPLRLPERRDRRRAALAAWGELAWPGETA